MRKYWIWAVVAAFVWPHLGANAQCANNNTFLLSYTPLCNNTSESVTNCIMGGQYVAINVVSGNVYTFSTCGNTAFDSQITIYNSGGGGALGYNDDGCGTQSTVTWTSTFTGVLWVLVDQYNCTSNSTCISLNVTCGTAPPAAAGDEPCTATPLTVSNSCNAISSTTAGSTGTTSVAAPGCASYTGFDVWFTAVVPASGSLTVQTQANVITDAGMAIYTGTSCSALTFVQCIDDVNGNSMPSAVINQTPGSTVYIRVWEYGGNNNGSFGICAFDNSPPPSSACLAPIPDACTNACDLGTLPTPPPCGSSSISPGSPLTFNLSNEGATAEVPYSSVSGCVAPGADVWYRFRSTGTQLVFSISGVPGNPLNNPNVSLYNGNNCNALLPLRCFTGTGGVLSATFQPVTPNDYYYLQISGGSITDMGDFTLVIRNNYSCDNCLLAQDLQVTPAPLNGTYGSGQTVQFCFTVSNYNQTAANWIHGIDLDFGAGWDLSTLAPTSIPLSCATTAGATWGYYNSVTGSASGNTYGPGFFYETSSGASSGVIDGNPGNNFGDVGVSTTCPRTFCWRIATRPTGSCTPGASLAVTINTLGDSESGSWSSAGCANDPAVNFIASLACCAPPALVVTPTGCGSSVGKIVATGQGSPPWDYVWSDSTGAVVATHNNVNGPDSITGLAAGYYTLTVSDNLGCSVGSAATVTGANGGTATAGNSGPFCTGQTISLTSTAGAAGYSWSGPGGFTSTQQNPTRASATLAMGGTYNVTVTYAGGCSATATTTVVVNSPPTASISPTTASVCPGGSITLTASGGGTYLWSNSGSTAAITVSPASSTTYTVTVTTATNCSATASRLVTIGAGPTATITPATVTICSGASATLTASGGTSYVWSTTATTAAITVSPTSTTTYTVTVTNASNCTATASRLVTVNTAPAILINPPAASICAGTSATLTASGGASYVWSTTATTAAITVSPANTTTYTVTGTAANTCSATATATVTVNALPVASVTPATTAICPGGSTTLTASGGTGYVWSTTATTAAITVSPTANTSYQVTVTNANNCSATAIANVTISNAAVATITPANPVICEGTSTTLTAAGGTGYVWSTTATTAAITVSPIQDATYTVTVTDANSCSGTASVLVTVVPRMSLSGFVTNVRCNGESNGAVNIAVGGGLAPYTYQWSNNATTQSLSAVPAGAYTVVVTDAAQCTASASATVTQPAIFAVAEQHTNVLCNGATTGSITLTPTGGTSPYSYTLNGLPGQSSYSNIGAGTYSIVATDNHQCSVALTIDITQPALLTVAETHTDAACNGTNTGSIDVTTQGGTLPYSYSWNDQAITEDRTSIPAGNYVLTVTDANLCSATISVTINQPQVLALSQVHQNVTCNAASTGSIDVTTTGGTSPYVYVWSDAVQTEDRNAIPAGNYQLVVYDINQCSATITVTVTEPTALSITETHTNVSCGGGGDGAIDITVNGATAPYNYLWNDGVTTQDRSALNIGTYTIGVADANQCTGTLTVNVGSASNLAVALQPTHVLCYGGNDGAINTTTTGGTQPYSYAWSDAVYTDNRTALVQGTYVLSVTDQNQCVVTASAVINEPPQLVVTSVITDVACNGGSTGSIDVTTAGGTQPYNFVWSDMVYAEDRMGVPAGSYQLAVADANQCTVTLAAVITEPTALTIAETHTNIPCNGGNTGAIDITVAGGVTPYTYLWNDAIQTEDRTAIPAGNYTVVGTDANLCTVSVAVAITQPAAIVVTEQHTDALCNGSADGRVTITATQGTAPLTYLWADGDTSSNRNDLTATTYIITVTDANVCSVSITATVGQPAAIAVSITHTNVSCLGYADGNAAVNATGGTPPYSYMWNNTTVVPGGTNAGIPAGNYDVVVYDSHQCSATGSVTITQPSGMAMNNTYTDPLCASKPADGTITLGISGGSQPYNYAWNNAAAGAQLQSLAPGTYYVTVTDANNCSMSDTFDLVYLYDFAIEVTPPVSIDFGETTTLGYTLTGVAGNYISLWSPGASLSCTNCVAPVASPINTTDYHLVVINDAGCVANGMVTVSVVPDYTVFVPNAFTPNNDGNNDVFSIYGNLKALMYVQMQVFNRWGEKIFESSDHQFIWDGTYKGELQPPGIYTWQLKLTFLNGHREELRKGTVTMIR